MKYKGLFLSILLFLLATVACFAYTPGQRVFDGADLFTTSEESLLEELCRSYAEETRTDFVILTTDDASGKTAEAYADDFYDNGGFGYDTEQGTGVLLLIDMDNREIYISTCGDAIYYMTDARIEKVLDVVYDEVVDGDYYEGAVAFMKKTREFLLKDPYAKPTFAERLKATAKRSPFYLVISGIVAAISSVFMKKSKEYKDTTNYTTYQDQGNFHLVQREDFFLRETTTTRRIVQDEGGRGGGGGRGSSTHISSGGVSHGGGGRKF